MFLFVKLWYINGILHFEEYLIVIGIIGVILISIGAR